MTDHPIPHDPQVVTTGTMRARWRSADGEVLEESAPVEIRIVSAPVYGMLQAPTEPGPPTRTIGWFVPDEEEST